MQPRQPFARSRRWPKRWLMTDERMGESLWPALNRLPRGSGVVFRHHATSGRDRLGRTIARICRRRGLLLAVSRDVGLARRLGASLVHNPTASPGLMPHSRSVHDEREARLARESGASLVFVSPVFTTRSHPDVEPLGIEYARLLAGKAGVPAIALGGMNDALLDDVRARGFAGYAGIDRWLERGPSRE